MYIYVYVCVCIYMYAYLHLCVYVLITPGTNQNDNFGKSFLLVWASFTRDIDQTNIKNGFSRKNGTDRYSKITFSTDIRPIHGQMQVSKIVDLKSCVVLYSQRNVQIYLYIHCYVAMLSFAVGFSLLLPPLPLSAQS